MPADPAELHRFAGFEHAGCVERFEDLRRGRWAFLGFQSEKIFHRSFQYAREAQGDGGVRHVRAGFDGVDRLASDADLSREIDGRDFARFSNGRQPGRHT
jgi:hypothetical protein